jgi:hypothetical protein
MYTRILPRLHSSSDQGANTVTCLDGPSGDSNSGSSRFCSSWQRLGKGSRGMLIYKWVRAQRVHMQREGRRLLLEEGNKVESVVFHSQGMRQLNSFEQSLTIHDDGNN